MLRRLVLGYVFLCFVATVALATTLAVGTGPWVDLIRYAPHPLLLAPLGLATGAAAVLGRAWLLAGIAAVVLFVVAVLDFNVGRPEPGPATLRVMTWNAKAHFARIKPGGIDAIAREIARHDPDLVVLQDAEFDEDIAIVPDPVRAAVGREPAVFVSGQYVVVSRLPMRDCHDGHVDGLRQMHPYVRCTVTAAGVDIDVVNVHLPSPREGLNAARFQWVDGLDDWARNFAERIAQSAAIVRDLAGPPRPLIVAGDLNAPERSPVVRQMLDMGLRDAFSQAGTGFGYTHGHALKPRFSFLRIDHILVSRHFGVLRVDTGTAKASEHRPVIADLGLRAP